MVYARLARIFPFTTFPLESDEATCATPLAYEIAVGAVRCIPVYEDGSPLDPGDSLDASLALIQDAMAMRKAIECCFGGDDIDIQLSAWEPQGPDGGCVGGEWTVVVARG
jgi:hypothetical protein